MMSVVQNAVAIDTTGNTGFQPVRTASIVENNISPSICDAKSPADDPTMPVITSAGLVTTLGDTAQETWDALLAGSYISDHTRVCADARDGEARVLALVRQAVCQLPGPNHFERDSSPDRTALVVATSKGPVEDWLTPPIHMSVSPYEKGGLRPAGLAEIADCLGNELDCRGPKLTISVACASGLLAMIRAAMLIRDGHADRVLVVAAEASVHPMFVSSFRRLGVLPKSAGGCRPFDQHREGFLMSEAAAAVWIERAGDIVNFHQDSTNPRLRLAIDGFAMGGDATHITGMDKTGRVLRRVIAKAIDQRPVDLVHTHGTGTVLNDPVELAAIQDVVAFQPAVPEIYSHKGALGHSLGASGLVSVALNYLMHSHGIIPPNIRTTNPIETGPLRIEPVSRRRAVNRSVAISAGFGGAIAAMTFKTL
jgi:3-oxoacyl-[acyl-carrier-protein] synthase II